MAERTTVWLCQYDENTHLTRLGRGLFNLAPDPNSGSVVDYWEGYERGSSSRTFDCEGLGRDHWILLKRRR